MNRTWADAAVEITGDIIGTIGPIGLGVVLIVGSIGGTIWALDRRGWMRPATPPARQECKAIDLQHIIEMLASHQGASKARHEVTHDLVREILNTKKG